MAPGAKDYARFDHALLVSLINGLGTWNRLEKEDEQGRVERLSFYEKDVDCLGECQRCYVCKWPVVESHLIKQRLRS